MFLSKTKAAYACLFSIKAIAYELHIYFGHYYQFQTRSVQFEICCESRTALVIELVLALDLNLHNDDHEYLWLSGNSLDWNLQSARFESRRRTVLKGKIFSPLKNKTFLFYLRHVDNLSDFGIFLTGRHSAAFLISFSPSA